MGKRSRVISKRPATLPNPDIHPANPEENEDQEMGVAESPVTLRLSSASRRRRLIDKQKKRAAATEGSARDEIDPMSKVPSRTITSPWKEPQARRTSSSIVSKPRTSWARKQKERAQRESERESAQEFKAIQQQAREEERRKAEQRRKLKAENERKSLVVQPITNMKKLKKMSKKQLKTIMKI